MRTLSRIGLAVALALAVVAVGVASDEKEVTLSGKILCAKCSLKKDDAKECQGVLVVEGGHAGEYYLSKNAVTEEFGHVCAGSKDAVVTGNLTEKDGRHWLEATKMEKPKES